MKNGFLVDGVTVSEIVFDKVMKSHECSGSVRVIGSIKGFSVGDEIHIGPTPMNKLRIRGNITGKDTTMSRLIFDVAEIISVPRISVKVVGRRAVRIDADATIQEAARILIRNGVREALVSESSPGLVSMVDIA